MGEYWNCILLHISEIRKNKQQLIMGEKYVKRKSLQKADPRSYGQQMTLTRFKNENKLQ